MSLCIIVTGQERTFWNGGSDQLMAVLTTSKMHYSRIHLILVLSGTFQRDKLDTFLVNAGVTYLCIDYTTNTCDTIVERLLRSPEYIDCKMRYHRSGIPTDAQREIPDTDTFVKRAMYQFHQLQLAIDNMNTLEPFDIVMKTRFDVWYHPGFYPCVPDAAASGEDRVLINETVKHTYRLEGIDVTSSAYMNLLLQNQVVLPKCRVPHFLYHYSLGGAFFSNHVALKRVLDGDNSVLYCFNDHVIFGRSKDFVQLRDFFNEYACRPPPVHITHFYAQEAQLIIFCLNHAINPIMYLHDTIHTILR